MKAHCEICSKPVVIPDATNKQTLVVCGPVCLDLVRCFEFLHTDDHYHEGGGLWLLEVAHWEN